MMKRRAILLCIIAFALSSPGNAQTPRGILPERIAADPDSLTAELYRAVTFAPGTLPDWSYVRSMFLPGAQIVLRVARDSTAAMSLDGFVDDFVRFIERARADSTGFQERVVTMKSTVMGNIAHLLVLYEASLPGRSRPPQQGVDSFHLMRREGRWWIVSIVNEVVTTSRPAPAELKG